VALGSTSRWTRTESTNPRERDVAHRLVEAEEAVRVACDTHQIDWTILRPTLIYDGETDRSVTVIARLVQWLGAFPVAGEGAGLRQPVHATEIAYACLDVLHAPTTFGRIYDTPGGETVTFAEMVRRIAGGAGRQVRLLHLPLPLVRAGLSVVRWLPGLRHLTPEMADRMNQDLVFDASEARGDFGFSPGPFRFPRIPPSC
jgi:nucleoside-diphosphate-sugar epimerase